MASMMPATKSATAILSGLREIAPQVEVLLCDIWGVIHNGRAVFPGAADALERFRRQGGVVILVSNAPRPAESVVAQLDGLSLPRASWDAIVTSGDVSRSHIAAQSGKRLFHLGPERDRPLFEGHALSFSSAAEAEVVVCTGLFDDTVETPADYEPMLREFLARQVMMICANPDLIVERAGKLVYCAGALAVAYEKMGGPVITCGKPHRPIYDAAFAVAASLLRRDVERRRTLAIGDSVRTDLAGAAAIGCRALFVAGGIHALEAGHGRGAEDRASPVGARGLDRAALTRFLAQQEVMPDAAMARLVW